MLFLALPPQCVELIFPGALFVVLVLLHGLVDSTLHAKDLGTGNNLSYYINWNNAAQELNNNLNRDNGYIIGVTPPTPLADIQAFFSPTIPANKFVAFDDEEAIKAYYNSPSYAVDPAVKSLLATIHFFDFVGPKYGYKIRLNSVRSLPFHRSLDAFSHVPG